MKIVNIDATKTISYKISEFQHFILEVISSLNSEIAHQFISQYHRQAVPSLPLSPIRKFNEDGYENIAYLLHTIPIYLRKSRPEHWNEEDVIDILGAYYPNRKNENDNPYIEMFVDNIYSSANGNEEHFKWLFIKVLIHELAHAALDIFNSEYCKQKKENVRYRSQFGKWREESMANAVALKIIKDFGNDKFYNFAKQFMLSQSAEYALGVLMEDFDYWDFRSVMDGKREGVYAGLQKEWLKYAQGNPSWKGLKLWNKILTSTLDKNKLIQVQDIDSDKYGMVDKDYKVHIPLEYDSISITSSGMYLVTKDNQYAILDCENNPDIPFGQYDRIDEECGDLRWIKKGTKFALVNRNFDPVIPYTTYEDVDRYVDGHAPVKLNGKWGVVNRSGKFVIPCEYDKICLYNRGAARMFKGDVETETNL